MGHDGFNGTLSSLYMEPRKEEHEQCWVTGSLQGITSSFVILFANSDTDGRLVPRTGMFSVGTCIFWLLRWLCFNTQAQLEAL